MVHGKNVVTEVTVDAPAPGLQSSKKIGLDSTKRVVMRADPQAKFVDGWNQIWIDENGKYATPFLLDTQNRVHQIQVEWNYG